jgi:hypothetical protein
MGARWRQHLASGRLVLFAHRFYSTTLPLWEMPAPLAHAHAQAALIIVRVFPPPGECLPSRCLTPRQPAQVKGDANYRRLIDDRLWPHDTPLVTAWGYLPAPLVALRTLKSEVCVGLAAGVSVCGRAETNAWLLTRGVG